MASNVSATTPAAMGPDAEVPVCSIVHRLRKSTEAIFCVSKFVAEYVDVKVDGQLSEKNGLSN